MSRIFESLGLIGFWVIQFLGVRNIYFAHPNGVVLFLMALWMTIYSIFMGIMFYAMWGEFWEK